MNISDPISDMLTRIRNAGSAGHLDVIVPASKLKVAISEVLKREGYIADYAVSQDGTDASLTLQLKYHKRLPVIAGLKRVSKPSRRIYAGVREIPRVMDGLGVAVLSTPEGVLAGNEAKRKNVGGEVLFYIW